MGYTVIFAALFIGNCSQAESLGLTTFGEILMDNSYTNERDIREDWPDLGVEINRKIKEVIISRESYRYSDFCSNLISNFSMLHVTAKEFYSKIPILGKLTKIDSVLNPPIIPNSSTSSVKIVIAANYFSTITIESIAGGEQGEKISNNRRPPICLVI